MNLTLWILQGVLAVVFAGSGAAKSTMSRERLVATGQTGIQLFPMPVVRFAAVCEMLAALGLVLPWATGILPVLTPLAATGLCVVMVGAAWSHSRLGEPRSVAANTLLFALALTVAIGRFAGL
ncbi:DoxX family protein [Dactylosporangium fulvum]|uniref:DoxX family protein n=1 Tax=Dactylosporangium fulvum TaxID=53359 RepID=A0ABY5W7M4_9ACTN|nr:DoxX family protein [Dactylosporangium fulvum]UWP84071.1 DoxX family protein [Dactylosporangium fulvum]